MFDYINKTYGLKVRMGMMIKMDGKPGFIKGVSGPHLLVKFKDYKEPVPVHPTWHMEYID